MFILVLFLARAAYLRQGYALLGIHCLLGVT
jgi:hypothetical protein